MMKQKRRRYYVYEMIASLKADIQDKHNKLEERMIALESRLDKKVEKLEKEVNEKVERKMEKKKEEIEGDINASFQFLEQDLQARMANTQQELNRLEQCTRKNSVRLFGIGEQAEETSVETLAVQVLKDKLKIDVEENDIEIAHRAGKYRPEGRRDVKKARPVLIKFASHKMKVKVMKAKKEFKGSQFWITEDLTKQTAERMKALNQMRIANKIKGAWTTDGKIKVRKMDDTIVMISSQDEIHQLQNQDD